MNSKILLFLLMAIVPVLSEAQDLKKDMPFLEARKQLLRTKWLPITLHAKDYAYIGVEKTLIRNGIKEIENCALDQSLCIFNYQKDGRCLRVISQGEKLKDMRVYEWKEECPTP